MEYEENIKIFYDTQRKIRTNERLWQSVDRSRKEQEIILEKDEIAVPSGPRYSEEAEIVVSRKNGFEAAAEYKGKKICVLDFASASYPGGGVKWGARPREESLCRTSTLYPVLRNKEAMEKYYYPHRKAHNPVHTDDCIYCPGITVFKDEADRCRLMEEKDWFEVNVIACAAPNLRDSPGLLTDSEMYELHYKRIGRVLDIAKAKGDEVVILGAFGCEAFRNNPRIVSRAMKKLTDERKYDFKVIEMAVYCRDEDIWKYEVFKSVFSDEQE